MKPDEWYKGLSLAYKMEVDIQVQTLMEDGMTEQLAIELAYEDRNDLLPFPGDNQ